MKTIIELSVLLPDGKRVRRCIDSTEFPIFSERYVDELKGPIPVGFDIAVDMMKERSFRRDLLRQAALQLSEQLGDYLEDSEGWHGERRRERIKELKE